MPRPARRLAPLDFAAFFALAAIFCLGVMLGAPKGAPPEVPPRTLATRPSEHFGREVVVPTTSFQREGERVVWRSMADDPPAVVLEFHGRPPAVLPKKVVGVVVWEDAGPVRVAGCRPAH